MVMGHSKHKYSRRRLFATEPHPHSVFVRVRSSKQSGSVCFLVHFSSSPYLCLFFFLAEVPTREAKETRRRLSRDSRRSKTGPVDEGSTDRKCVCAKHQPGKSTFWVVSRERFSQKNESMVKNNPLTSCFYGFKRNLYKRQWSRTKFYREKKKTFLKSMWQNICSIVTWGELQIMMSVGLFV